MTEYINTTTLLKEIDHAFHTDTIGKKDVINLIINLPAADVAPVRQGRWLLDGRCSECLANPLTTHRAYCPACGARMDGGED